MCCKVFVELGIVSNIIRQGSLHLYFRIIGEETNQRLKLRFAESTEFKVYIMAKEVTIIYALIKKQLVKCHIAPLLGNKEFIVSLCRIYLLIGDKKAMKRE